MSAPPDILDRSRSSKHPFFDRVPSHGTTLVQMGTALVVGDCEAVVLMVDGRAADGFGPGRHVLTTSSVPLATRALALPYGSASAFETVVCFVREGVSEEQRWGTRIPVAFRDNMFGMIRVRAFGTYRARVVNPPLFLNTVIAPAALRYGGRVEDLLRDLVASRLADYLSDQVDTVIDLTRYVHTAPDAIHDRLGHDFGLRGVELCDFSVTAFTVPLEVLETLETRSGLAAVRSVCDYFREQSLRALGLDESGSENGADGEFGEADAEDLADWDVDTRRRQVKWGVRTTSEPDRMRRCDACHTLMPADAHFCARCGHSFYPRTPCLSCGQQNPPEWGCCMRCGHPRGRGFVCKGCSAEIPMGSRYCMACGNPTSNEEREAA